MAKPENSIIFISHAAVDNEIALSLKCHLQSALPGSDIFVSSDPEDLPLGDSWVQEILSALAKAKLVLALTTERGLSRRWVWFESGRTWFSGIACIPCCIGKVRKDGLPAPFSSLTAMNLDEVDELKTLVARCSEELNITANTTKDQLAKISEELIRLDIRAEERQRTLEDPFNSEMSREVERVMRGLGPGEKEALRILLKYGELTDRVAANKVRESGKSTNQLYFLNGLHDRTGWLQLTQMSPYPNVSREEDRFAILPRMRPYLTAWFERNRET
jgi:hypothetical protein